MRCSTLLLASGRRLGSLCHTGRTQPEPQNFALHFCGFGSWGCFCDLVFGWGVQIAVSVIRGPWPWMPRGGSCAHVLLA